MTTYALWALLILAAAWFALLTAFVAAAAYIANRRDRAWDAETADLAGVRADIDAAWEQHVAEALAAGSTTPIGDATASHIAAHLAADVDAEWLEMNA